MGLDGALSIATSGLAAVQGQITVVSQNIANASTAGYAEEVAPVVSVEAGGLPAGVRLGAAIVVAAPALPARRDAPPAAGARRRGWGWAPRRCRRR